MSGQRRSGVGPGRRGTRRPRRRALPVRPIGREHSFVHRQRDYSAQHARPFPDHRRDQKLVRRPLEGGPALRARVHPRVMVDLMYMQRELHPGMLAVMDATVMGDGAGPRTRIPREGNLILASSDQVAIDAMAAKIMGFDPLSIRYLAMCHERGLGVADPRDIEIVGDVDAAATNMGFTTSRSLVIWGDQLIRRGPLKPLKRLLLHSPLMVWAPFASNVYHDLLWYPTVGRARIRAFAGTGWGRLFDTY